MRVIVLLGGDSPERDVSKVSGKAVAEALQRRGHRVIAVDTAGPQAGQPLDFETRPLQVGSEPPSIALVPANEAIHAVERIGAQSYGEVDAVFVALPRRPRRRRHDPGAARGDRRPLHRFGRSGECHRHGQKSPARLPSSG
mgnify:CR=1 FL=1